MPEKQVSYQSKYYWEHKEKIVSKQKEKQACEKCGKMITHNFMKRHMKGLSCAKNSKVSDDKVDQIMKLLKVTEEDATKILSTGV
jgi:hypothetical protein